MRDNASQRKRLVLFNTLATMYKVSLIISYSISIVQSRCGQRLDNVGLWTTFAQRARKLLCRVLTMYIGAVLY